MADVAMKLETRGCAEKQRLLSEVNDTHLLIASIHNQEVEAVLRGDSSIDEWLQAQLKRMMEVRVLMIQKLRQHIAEHHC